MKCLAVDVGNTSTTLALVDGRTVRASARARTHPAVTEAAAARALRRLVRSTRVDGGVLASVVPAVNGRWIRALRAVCGAPPVVVHHRLPLGVRVSYPRPGTIGADRLANAAAAVERYGAPVIVADFGTALTFDVVTAPGIYIGGVIAPGLPLMTDYLAERTALLPRLDLRPGVPRGVGRSTRGAMRLGATVGYRGMVREIVAHLRRVPALRRARLAATGGYARLAVAGLRPAFTVDPWLTVRGLARIFELNRERTDTAV